MIGYAAVRKGNADPADFKDEDFFSVEYAPDLRGHVVFTSPSAEVFREDSELSPLHVSDSITVMPWGDDNMMPYRLMELVDDDETVATCMNFNAEVAFASGVCYRPKSDVAIPAAVRSEIEDFTEGNNLNTVWLLSLIHI